MLTPDQAQQVFDALDLGALPEDEQQEVMLTMGELIFRGTLVRCLEAMSSGDREEFAKLAESDASPDDIADYVVKHVADADRFVGEAVEDLAGDILAVTKAKA